MSSAAILLIRRRRPVGESAELEPGSTRGASVLRGTAGAGRVRHELAELGIPTRTVIQSVHEDDTTAEDLAGLDVGRLFVVVVLGSHLVNVPDAGVRRAYLDAARRHLVGDCDVVVEHHPVDWTSTAAEVRAAPGGAPGMTSVRVDPPFVSAVAVFDSGGREVRQPFTARVLSESELAQEPTAAGLFIRQRLSPTWLVAGPVTPRAWSVAQPPHP